ncbi:unannotated protein [freshwater metagenome]|uniref:Unannotated protein n=1 Tax=freshwater metagenome TaxID=449393 RepID=A0A6J7IZQ9_9ZZZZ
MLALAGCGASTSGQDPKRLLEDAFGTGQKPVTSGRLGLDARVRAAGIEGIPSPLRLTLDGPFQSRAAGGTPKFAFTIGLATADGSVKLGVLSTGTRGWVTLGQRAYTLSPAQFAQLGKAGSPSTPGGSGVSLATLGVDPRAWLRDTEEVGVETLDGVQVVHLRSGVDTAVMLEDLGRLLDRAGGVGAAAGVGSLSALDRTAAQKALKSAQVDLWIGERDHILRRLLVVARVDTAAQRGGTMRLDLTLEGVGKEQAIGPPANPRPLSELAAALAQLARLRAPGAQSDQGAASGSSDLYDSCVTNAAGNVTKVQACSALLR